MGGREAASLSGTLCQRLTGSTGNHQVDDVNLCIKTLAPRANHTEKQLIHHWCGSVANHAQRIKARVA
jgi:hypothetical protein